MKDLLLPLGAAVAACLLGIAVYLGAPLIWRDIKAWRRWKRYNSRAMKRSRYESFREMLNEIINEVCSSETELHLDDDEEWLVQTALYDVKRARVA